jgi:hypothetical protein
VNPTWLQTLAVNPVTTGLGLTVTMIEKSSPVQVPEEGVTVYMAVWAEFVGFVRVQVNEVPLPEFPPVTPPVTVGADQTYVVPAGTTPLVMLTGDTVSVASLQAEELIGAIAGLGFTVTITEKSTPVQNPEVGVTV